jgi:hypothetical protein
MPTVEEAVEEPVVEGESPTMGGEDLLIDLAGEPDDVDAEFDSIARRHSEDDYPELLNRFEALRAGPRGGSADDLLVVEPIRRDMGTDTSEAGDADVSQQSGAEAPGSGSRRTVARRKARKKRKALLRQAIAEQAEPKAEGEPSVTIDLGKSGKPKVTPRKPFAPSPLAKDKSGVPKPVTDTTKSHKAGQKAWRDDTARKQEQPREVIRTGWLLGGDKATNLSRRLEKGVDVLDEDLTAYLRMHAYCKRRTPGLAQDMMRRGQAWVGEHRKLTPSQAFEVVVCAVQAAMMPSEQEEELAVVLANEKSQKALMKVDAFNKGYLGKRRKWWRPLLGKPLDKPVVLPGISEGL